MKQCVQHSRFARISACAVTHHLLIPGVLLVVILDIECQSVDFHDSHQMLQRLAFAPLLMEKTPHLVKKVAPQREGEKCATHRKGVFIEIIVVNVVVENAHTAQILRELYIYQHILAWESLIGWRKHIVGPCRGAANAVVRATQESQLKVFLQKFISAHHASEVVWLDCALIAHHSHIGTVAHIQSSSAQWL